MISPVKILDILLSWALLSDTLSVTHLKWNFVLALIMVIHIHVFLPN
jgi:hypothetical protein